MVDIDGVISLFGVPDKDDTPDTPRGSLHAVDGTVHFLSATAAAHLLELSQLYDLVWASGWEERAEEHLPRLLGLPAGLPYLRFEREPGNSGAHWKLEAIERFAAGPGPGLGGRLLQRRLPSLGRGQEEPHAAGGDRAPGGADRARVRAAARMGGRAGERTRGRERGRGGRRRRPSPAGGVAGVTGVAGAAGAGRAEIASETAAP